MDRLMRAVLLDALGTLVELPAPAPALVEELAARGVTVSEAEAGRAIRTEIAFYRAEHHVASTLERLAELRARCTDVLRDALPAHAREVPDLQAALLGALRFRAYPEVPGVLRAWRDRGVALVVASNWDVSLHEVLEVTGLAPLLDGVVTSAELGVAKPDSRLLRAALDVAGADPAGALHVGDSVEHDVAAARAAGVEVALVVRDGAPAPGAVPPGVRTVRSLAELLTAGK
jgi:putative hydrolase of the HAD superfamily